MFFCQQQKKSLLVSTHTYLGCTRNIISGTTPSPRHSLGVLADDFLGTYCTSDIKHLIKFCHKTKKYCKKMESY